MVPANDIVELQRLIRGRKHSLHDLRMALQALPRAQRFDALLGIFTENQDADTFSDQDVAGRLLVDVMPDCRLELEAVLDAVAATWNASVEELPMYLGTKFGREAVIAAANSLSQKWATNDRRSEAMRTIAWWLENRRADRRTEMRTNQRMHPSRRVGRFDN
ncbi:MAG: hypothetical protein AAF497_22200 [Planctomycetota bacterium]